MCVCVFLCVCVFVCVGVLVCVCVCVRRDSVTVCHFSILFFFILNV